MITQAERKLKYATLIRLTVSPDGQVNRSMQLLTVGKKAMSKPLLNAMVDKYNNNPEMKRLPKLHLIFAIPIARLLDG